MRSRDETVSVYGAAGTCDAVVRSRLSELSTIAERSFARLHAAEASATAMSAVLPSLCISHLLLTCVCLWAE